MADNPKKLSKKARKQAKKKKANVQRDSPALNVAMQILKRVCTKKFQVPAARAMDSARCFGNGRGCAGIIITSKDKLDIVELTKEIEIAANAEVKVNRPVSKFAISRGDAEKQYGEAMYSGSDPEIGTNPAETLQLMWIEGCSLSVCSRPVLGSTAGVGTIKIVKILQKDKKGVYTLQVTFALSGSAEDTCDGAKAGDAPSADVVAALDQYEDSAAAAKIDLRADIEAKVEAAIQKAQEALSALKNVCYSKLDDDKGIQTAGTQTLSVLESNIEALQYTTEKMAKTFVVDPWKISGIVDYEKLIRDFGSQRIEQDLIDRMERLTGKRAHHWLRRGLFFSHRDLKELLDCYEKGEQFYLYTGRGPSSEALHLGHLVPFTFTKWLQDTFDVPLVIQLTDDEKFFWKELELAECHRLGHSNAKDIIACGFDPDKTFIFSDLEYIGGMYPNICKIRKKVTFSTARGVFGFDPSSHIGKIGFPAVQAAPSFSSSFPVVLGGKKMRCLIPQAIDQDPYFRLTRDVAPRLGEYKPALIHSKFFPALQGFQTKMSSSTTSSAIYVSDDEKTIRDKINKYAFSGGGVTLEEHEKNGANLEVDIAYQYLRFFMEDDKELARIGKEYGEGRMKTSEVKAILVKLLADITTRHRNNRAKVTEEIRKQFMAVRPLKFQAKRAASSAASAAAPATSAQKLAVSACGRFSRPATSEASSAPAPASAAPAEKAHA